MVIQPLKGVNAFRTAVKSGRQFSAGPARITVASTSLNGIGQIIRVAVIVGKRSCPKAVVRVRIRRLLRSAVRDVITKHQDRFRKSAIGTVVVAWRSAPASASLIHLCNVEPYVKDAMLQSLNSMHSVREEA
ncbi:MAG: ribonuclease P protein component [Ignavibacteria bacterium]|nr:ribonuclease P protein component [Ignavibacteria bacterium]